MAESPSGPGFPSSATLSHTALTKLPQRPYMRRSGRPVSGKPLISVVFVKLPKIGLPVLFCSLGVSGGSKRQDRPIVGLIETPSSWKRHVMFDVPTCPPAPPKMTFWRAPDASVTGCCTPVPALKLPFVQLRKMSYIGWL